MDTRQALRGIPAGDFLRVGKQESSSLPREKRVALIRKGNELFNDGNIELAKRIFLTTRYTDGLVRLGDYYYEQKQPLEAFRMYYAAPYRRRTGVMVEQMAQIIKEWLREGP